MTTDRELLEAAARAAGVALSFKDDGDPFFAAGHGLAPRGLWNPLTDDGDALRLAVKLGIGIAIPNKKFPGVRRVFLSDISGFTVTDKDPCAATRRAIVRAAAEMGK